MLCSEATDSSVILSPQRPVNVKILRPSDLFLLLPFKKIPKPLPIKKNYHSFDQSVKLYG